MALAFVFFLFAILAPLLVHLKGCKPATLFVVAAFAYAVFAGINFAEAQIAASKLTSSTKEFRYYSIEVYRGNVSVVYGLILTFFGVLTWVQTRFGAMLHPRTTKGLFLVLHLSLFGARSHVLIFEHFIPWPRRYIHYPSFMKMWDQGQLFSFYVAIVTGLGLIGLLVWSAIVRHRIK